MSYLAPLSVSETTRATQTSMTLSPPSSLCSSAFLSPLEISDPGPSKQLQNDFLDLNIIQASIDSIIMSIMPSSVSPPPVSKCVTIPSLPRVSPPKTPPYNLRSLANRTGKGLVIGGLASDPVSIGPRKLRGRKSYLSKAQLKAKLDIADGKQRSLSGVLRAAQPPSQGLR